MVYVRVKPHDDERSIIDIVDDETLVFDPIDEENQPRNGQYQAIGTKRNKNSTYSFDKVFDERATNYSIYETVTRPMVEATINGLNCSVFAYGATGSGKTYTMLGSSICPGVIYHTSKDLFGKLSLISESDPLPADLKICYFEIYNERVRDLLVLEPSSYIKCGNKRLRTTPERCKARKQFGPRDNTNLLVCEGTGDNAALVIPDLSYHRPSDADQLIRLLETGNSNRSQHPTDANADSSRSHAIFQIVLTRRLRRLNGSDYQLQTSKLSLIDLAGSERASVAYRAGNDRSKNLQREGGNINKSLLALGNCINALANPKLCHKHIPYRNSKLTRLLRDSLGGKCRTAMIATVCQQSNHYDDTQNTLVYASRAKCIKLKPGRNVMDIAIQPKNYSIVIENQNRQITTLRSQNEEQKMEIEQHKLENAHLRRKLESLESKTISATRSQFEFKSSSNFLLSSKFKGQLDNLYEKRRYLRLELLKNESKYRMNELKLEFKRLDDARQQVLHGQIPKMNGNTTVLLVPAAPSVFSAGDQSQALRAQLDFYDKERKALLDKVAENEDQINEVISNMTTEYEMREIGTPEDFDSLIEPYLHEKEQSHEIEQKAISEQHAYDLAQAGINRLVATENLLADAAQVVRYVHAVAKSLSLSAPLEAKVSELLKRLDGKKSLVWKDDKYAMENERNHEPLHSVHDNFSLNFTPFRNNNTLNSRRLTQTLVSLSNYTPEQSNATFDASQ